ncbi:DUF3750 domain-containing protein [Fulvimarina endophytica]|uniref:DUF3750 domain-containing protein n=1 Tax=Fulvimarina endophytica TaxID=2293836 RepID=A0A371XAR2_9HYPH|nr:DUF3750 domain-containing protein [Fulvimarina endophytica]RFC66326.1 DUF3750 domain-containing protein [Fulvimarina endophytica]
MKIIRTLLFVFLALFVLPSAVSAGLWWLGDNPRSWGEADWSSARVLPEAGESRDAAVYVMSARTGGLKGAVSVHSWLVLKDEGADRYERWDVVGWGMPVRQNNWDPDGRWYSNQPQIVGEAHGELAADLIPRLRQAITDYRFSNRGDYRIFPGPNSNTFVATVLRDLPGFAVTLPAPAVGRDYPVDGELASLDRARGEFRASLFGYAGIVLGRASGLEINVLGLVAGINPFDLSVTIPAFGTYSLLNAANFA